MAQTFNISGTPLAKSFASQQSSAPLRAPKGGTVKNSSGQLINESGEVVGGAVSSSGGGLSYGSGNIPGSNPVYVDSKVGQSTIPALDIGNVSPVNLPVPNFPKTGNEILALATQYAPQPTTETKSGEGDSSIAELMKTSMSMIQKPESKMNAYEDIYGVSPAQAKASTDAAQARVSSLGAQLAGINAKTQTDLLTLRGIAGNEGVTEVVYGGQETRINREAAIKAYPVAAELSAAQGDLKTAQKHLDSLFDMRIKDIDSDFEYRTKLADTFMAYANKAEQRQYDQILQTQRDIKDSKKENIEYMRKMSDKALQSGQPRIMAKIASLDPSSPSFNKDIGIATIDLKMSELDRAQLDNIYSSIRERNAKVVKEENLLAMVTPPLINPKTGKADPLSQLTSIMAAADGKTDDKLKLTAAVLSGLQTLAHNNSTGNFAGTGPFRLNPSRFVSQAGQDNRTAMAALEGTVEAWMTGASVGEDQAKRIKEQMVPKEAETDKTIKQKTNALANYMMDYAKGNLATQGIPYSPGKVDFWKQDITNMSNEELLNSIPGNTAPVSNEAFFNSVTP